ncbi:biotin--[acetyl-CoA-carboxylase] ligase [Xanthovirga aplysinae]|uniref:biotin--[acetyl-CoA-carboxylase] ligase n=1 Tax=Xanthovirga aplysinae TaxID=2529853 RepID=UPI0012BD2E80|nr:biotin--[acetyl-CoA-carboxylase] ligase [Xanthovirga aplysinae]MTI32303.1 biotin--[acetyl-CoA-carboxylase] ligase [Xanthovirga aplysinae]
MHKIFANTLFAGKQVISLPTCHSTNDIAAALVSKGGTFEGTLVITDQQTAGKGQRGNQWEAEPGKNLTFSLILKPGFLNISQQFALNMAVSLGVHDTLFPLLGDGLKVKWPNDIYFFDKKLGGILIENTLKNNNIEFSVVGVGINVNQEKFSTAKATSLTQIVGSPFELREVLSTMLQKIEVRYLQLKESGESKIRPDYLESLYWYNEPHTFLAEDYFTGLIKGIDPIGRLIIERESNVQYFSLKEVSFIE